MVKIIELSGSPPVAATGSGTATITGTEKATGFVEKVVYVYEDGQACTVAITATGAVTETVMTKAGVGVSDETYYPRVLGNKVADASSFTNVAEKVFVHQSSFNAVVGAAGTAAPLPTYRFLIYLSDE